jgi:hypothetical protein
MVKRREPKAKADALGPQPTHEQIEAFAAGAAGGVPLETLKAPDLDPNATRNYKAMRVPFNQHEYEQLAVACKLSGRTKLNFMRYAMLKLAKEMQQ